MQADTSTDLTYSTDTNVQHWFTELTDPATVQSSLRSSIQFLHQTIAVLKYDHTVTGFIYLFNLSSFLCSVWTWSWHSFNATVVLSRRGQVMMRIQDMKEANCHWSLMVGFIQQTHDALISAEHCSNEAACHIYTRYVLDSVKCSEKSNSIIWVLRTE